MQPRPEPERAIAYGLFSVLQARAAGYSRAEVEKRRTRGQWVTVERGILLAAGRVPAQTDGVVLALLRAGPQAVASHETAATLYGWDLVRPPSRIHVTMPPSQVRVRAPATVTLHWSTGDVQVVSGVIAVTGACRTVLDLAGTLPTEPAVVAVDAALRAGSVSLEALRAELCTRRTWDRAQHAQTTLSLASTRSGSVPETQARLLFASGGLPPPTEQLEVRVDGVLLAGLDFGWEAELVAVEIDGYRYHSGMDAFQHDRIRQNALVLAGWTILRFTVHDLECRRAEVVAEVRAALHRAQRRSELRCNPV